MRTDTCQLVRPSTDVSAVEIGVGVEELAVAQTSTCVRFTLRPLVVTRLFTPLVSSDTFFDLNPSGERSDFPRQIWL